MRFSQLALVVLLLLACGHAAPPPEHREADKAFRNERQYQEGLPGAIAWVTSPELRNVAVAAYDIGYLAGQSDAAAYRGPWERIAAMAGRCSIERTIAQRTDPNPPLPEACGRINRSVDEARQTDAQGQWTAGRAHIASSSAGQEYYGGSLHAFESGWKQGWATGDFGGVGDRATEWCEEAAAKILTADELRTTCGGARVLTMQMMQETLAAEGEKARREAAQATPQIQQP